jgi:hypothetical protein
MSVELSIFNRTFWDLFIQKCLRNVASVKYQFMAAFFWVVVYGMFFKTNAAGLPYIGSVEGLAFLGGGFITLATSRIVLRTSLFEPKCDVEGENGSAPTYLDTDK